MRLRHSQNCTTIRHS